MDGHRCGGAVVSRGGISNIDIKANAALSRNADKCGSMSGKNYKWMIGCIVSNERIIMTRSKGDPFT